MPLLTVENHVNLSLISLNIAPGTFLAFAVLAFAYLYIIHVRNNPQPRLQVAHIAAHQVQGPVQHNGAPALDRGAGARIRRPPLIKRISARLRTNKQQRDQPIAPLRLPFPSLWLPLGRRLGYGRLDLGRQIQPAGVAPRRKRQSKQRLLE